jgi:hypothetical protein
MGGCMTTMLLLFFAFAPMEQFQLHFLTSLDVFMTVRLWSLVRCMTNWKIVYCTMGGKCCVNSAFGSMKRNYLYKLCQDHLGSKAPMHWEKKLDLQKKRQATSARQTADWGMLTMQASFPRVKDRFVYKEKGERWIVLKMFVMLYNIQARMVEINQIQNTYMRHLLNAMEMKMFGLN